MDIATCHDREGILQCSGQITNTDASLIASTSVADLSIVPVVSPLVV